LQVEFVMAGSTKPAEYHVYWCSSAPLSSYDVKWFLSALILLWYIKL